MSYNPVNPNGQATSANSAPVVIASDQSAVQTKITDGTQTANTVAGDSGQNALLTTGNRKEVSFSTSSVQAVASTDASNYSHVSVHVVAQGTSSTITFQGSNDNSNWVSVMLGRPDSATGALADNTSTTSAGVVFEGPLTTRYFRLNVTGISAGTTSGVVEFFANARAPHTGTQAAQSGTWTVGANSATGSAVPANAFYGGGLAQTALPTAATAGNLTGEMMDKFGRQITLNNTIRDLTGTQTTTISSTTETTIVTAAASVFNDLIAILISNTSTSAVRVDIRDTTGGSVIFQLYVPGSDVRGLTLTTPWPQTSVNTNWTAQLSSAVTDIRVSCIFAKNR